MDEQTNWTVNFVIHCIEILPVNEEQDFIRMVEFYGHI